MNINKVLGVIVAGCLMVTAFSIVDYTKSINKTKVQPEVKTIVMYVPVSKMPVRETVKINQKQLDCLAVNLYFEARNQKTDTAMAAVGYTVLNRVASKGYPNSVCGVVYQGRKLANGNYVRHKCQFSWVCDGAPDVPSNKNKIEIEAWLRAREVAMQVLKGTIDNPVGNATMYHATYVNPYWRKAYSMVAKIEDHIFYEKA